MSALLCSLTSKAKLKEFYNKSRSHNTIHATGKRTHHPAASRSAGLQPVFACRLSFDSGALGVGVASRGRGSERPATRAGWSPAAGD